MNPDHILNIVADAIREVVQCGSVAISRETRAMEVRGWDSLSQTMILLRLEDIFGIVIPIEKAMGLRNVGELVDLIAQLKAMG